MIIAIMLPMLGSWAYQNCPDDYTYQRSDGRQAVISLRDGDSTAVIEYRVDGELLSEWEIRHKVFRFCCGDMTGDGIPEIAVGVIKPTRYSPDERKRLWLLKLYEEELIRPLWLSSRLSHRLEDFSIEPDGTILSSEVEEDGTPVKVRYRYRGFGLKYIDRSRTGFRSKSSLK